jgi:ABC-type dipeptide/oligopeptide/nickel transport system permease component
VPGDPAEVLLGEQATPERVVEVRRALGLDRPLAEQYWRFVSRAVRGDFGESVRAMRPVLPYVLERLPATLELSLGALVLSAGLGVPLGVLAAARRHSVWDALSMQLALLAQSTPNFWAGLMLIALFSVKLQLLPVSGRGSLRHLVLPSITLAIFFSGLVVRLTRSGMLEVLAQDYVRTAWAKGMPERLVIFRHALKNALIPIVTVLGLQVGTLLGGAVVTETVFAWPGMGQLAVQAIYQRDYPVVQAIVLLLGTAFVFINWAVDVSYCLLDPRIQYR